MLISAKNQFNQKEESLNDFLFAKEPPCDPVQPLALFSNESNCSARSSELKIDAPVQVWLSHLRFQVEEEFDKFAEVKLLPKRQMDLRNITEESLNRDLKLMTISATTAATRLLDKAKRFDGCYQELTK